MRTRLTPHDANPPGTLNNLPRNYTYGVNLTVITSPSRIT
jgi:hypothetical protein